MCVCVFLLKIGGSKLPCLKKQRWSHKQSVSKMLLIYFPKRYYFIGFNKCLFLNKTYKKVKI